MDAKRANKQEKRKQTHVKYRLNMNLMSDQTDHRFCFITNNKLIKRDWKMYVQC